MTALMLLAAGLLALGTLTTAVDALTPQARPALTAAGKLLWCAAGALAIGGAVAALCFVATAGPSTESFGSFAFHMISGVCIATAATLLLRLFGGLPTASDFTWFQQEDERDPDEIEQ